MAELERDHTPKGEEPERVQRFPQLLKPFGFLNEEWEEMKRQMRPGDELWEFCNEKKMWDAPIGLGLAGVELVRNGQVIANLITKRN